MLTAADKFEHEEAIVQERREKSRGGMKYCVLEADIFLLAVLYCKQWKQRGV
jgi:hypothetical protein